MIFTWYSRFKIKVGEEEEYIFDRTRLMYTEVAEIEKCSGLTYGEWEYALRRYSITALAPLLHVLRKREGVTSDWAVMQFNAAQFDCIPVHDDDSEYTVEELEADLAKRTGKDAAEPDPTRAGAGAVPPEPSPPPATTTSSRSSPNGSASGRGNGTSSPGATSPSSRPISTLPPQPGPGDPAPQVSEGVGHDGGDIPSDAAGIVG
jgi:hypothetical protein